PNPRLDTLIPPLLVALNRQYRQFLPLEVKAVLRLDVWQTLPERQQIGTSRPHGHESSRHSCRLLEVLIPFVLQASHTWKPTVNGQCMSLNIYATNAGRLPLNEGFLLKHCALRLRV